MRVLVLAAGEATRWGNHLGIPKHLIRIGGETLLERNTRLAKEIDPDADVRIIARGDDDRYRAPGAVTDTAQLDPAKGDIDKFASSRHLWDDNGRTVLLYGDTILTREAMRAIMSPEPRASGWHLVSRFTPSELTGTEWGENFALVVDPHAHRAVSWHTDTLAARQADLWRIGGWELYALLCGMEPDCPVWERGNATIIDDWSDDFDLPEDYDRWASRFTALTLEQQAEVLA